MIDTIKDYLFLFLLIMSCVGLIAAAAMFIIILYVGPFAVAGWFAMRIASIVSGHG